MRVSSFLKGAFLLLRDGPGMVVVLFECYRKVSVTSQSAEGSPPDQRVGFKKFGVRG